MLQITNLTKSYGSRVLFEDVNFSLTPRERLGLVGRNGCGKSTLFKLILEEEHAESGTIVAPRGYRVGHLAQHLEFHEPNILKEVCLGLPEEERDQEYRGEIILDGLGFSQDDFCKPASEFSGGFQIRLNLAKLLLSEPNLLLLDEPTNYLDIVSMRWLSSFLRGWRNELIIISHDRSFMNSVTTHTMLVHRGTIKKVIGGTEKLYAQVAQDEEIYEKTRVNEDKKRKDLELFINRFRAQASKATLVQSKIKALERMGSREALMDLDTLDFSFCEAPFPGKQMLDVKHVSFAYPGGEDLIKDFSFNIHKHDRICFIGKNGKGKSTLLRLLCGELTPVSGEIVPNLNSSIGYFGQSNIARLNPNMTVEEEVTSANPHLSRTKIRAICGTMMFSGDDALKKVSVLSGGEKSRVLLGKLLALPTNILLLDEPTNHLDQESIEALIDSLNQYQGAVIIVTHSELLLRKLAKRLVVFQGDTPQVLNHDYDYFLAKEGWKEEGPVTAKAPSSKKGKQSKESKESAPQEPKQAKKLQRQVAEIEKIIATSEQELEKTQAELSLIATKGNYAKVGELSQKLKSLQGSIADSYAKWEELSAQIAG